MENFAIERVNRLLHRSPKRRTLTFEVILKARLKAVESPLKMLENALHFTLKTLFLLKVFKFLSLLFGQVEKRLD